MGSPLASRVGFLKRMWVVCVAAAAIAGKTVVMNNTKPIKRTCGMRDS
jgi:hypothetical protein